MIPEKIQDNKPELTTELIGYTDSQFGMDALIANNKYRAMHNAPPLRFNEGLAKMAQNWAEKLAKIKKLEQTPNHMRTFNNVKIGENLCYSFNSKLTGDKMLDIWYAESKLHNYKLESQVNTQNFTQLIWRSTKEVGFGRAKSLNGEVWYGVAMYSPSGNVIGKYAENVLPPNI